MSFPEYIIIFQRNIILQIRENELLRNQLFPWSLTLYFIGIKESELYQKKYTASKCKFNAFSDHSLYISSECRNDPSPVKLFPKPTRIWSGTFIFHRILIHTNSDSNFFRNQNESSFVRLHSIGIYFRISSLRKLLRNQLFLWSQRFTFNGL